MKKKTVFSYDSYTCFWSSGFDHECSLKRAAKKHKLRTGILGKYICNQLSMIGFDNK